MHNQFKTQKFKHLMLAMGPRDLNSAPYSPVHCSSHSMTSFQSSELTELPVVENSQLFAQRAHSARYAPLVTRRNRSPRLRKACPVLPPPPPPQPRPRHLSRMPLATRGCCGPPRQVSLGMPGAALADATVPLAGRASAYCRRPFCTRASLRRAAVTPRLPSAAAPSGLSHCPRGAHRRPSALT